MTSTAVRAVCSLLAAFALAGCVASKNPIGPASEAVAAPRLAGVWVKEGDADGREYLHILADAADDKRLQILAVNHGDKVWAVLDGYVTAMGERRFINLQLTDADAQTKAEIDRSRRKESHPFSFVAIAFDGDDRLAVAYPLEPLLRAVKDGRLSGETRGDYDVFINDSSDKIAAVLGTVDEAHLFPEPQHDQRSQDFHRYRRVKLPP